MPEEPIHGALTYRLALMAGFKEVDAAQLALAAGGVDHHPYMRPCTDAKQLAKEIFVGVLWNAGGTHQGYDPHYNTPETPPYLREMVSLLPDTPGLAQTMYYHFRPPEQAVRDVARLIVRGKGYARLQGDRQRVYLNDLGVAFHLLEDVGVPWAHGAHTGAPFGRFPVGDNPIGHPGGDSTDLAGHPIHMTPNIGLPPYTEQLRSASDIPYNAPALFRKELPEIYKFLVMARNAFYGRTADPAAARRGPTPDEVNEVQETSGLVPVPDRVTEEIERAIKLQSRNAAREYMKDTTIYLLKDRSRERTPLPHRAHDMYKPGEMARQYQRLAPHARAEVNRQVDDLFRARTGIMARLDSHDATERPQVREWLRIRDEIMEKRVSGGAEEGGFPWGRPEDYELTTILSYAGWLSLNGGAMILGKYQLCEWTWPWETIDVGGYK